MYNPIKTIKSVYRRYDADNGTMALALGGAIVGNLAGFAFPLYVGWEIGEYVKNALEFGELIGTATKAFGAVSLTYFIWDETTSIGIWGGVAIGGGIGVAIGKAKKSLEKLVSKK